MRSITGTITFLSIYFISFAQPGAIIDSLNQKLQKHTKADSHRLNLLIKLAQETRSGAESKVALAEAEVLIKRLNLPEKYPAILIIKAGDLQNEGNDTAAFALVQQAYQLYEKGGDKIGMFRSLRGIGLIFQQRGEYYKAIEQSLKCLKLLEKENDPFGKGACTNDIGVCYFLLADYPQSITYYLKALKLFEEAGRNDKVAMVYANIGRVYKRLGKYNEALVYARKAHTEYHTLKDSFKFQKTLHFIVMIYDS